MRPNALRQFLGKGNMVSDTLRDTIALCEEWYAAEPSIVTFVLLSLFHHLERRGWDNRQGVATAQYDPFKNMVLPHLIAIADLLIKAPLQHLPPNLTTLSLPTRPPSRRLLDRGIRNVRTPWPVVPLGRVLKHRSEFVTIDDTQTY